MTRRKLLSPPVVSFPGRSDITALNVIVSSSANPVMASICAAVNGIVLFVFNSASIITDESPSIS